MSGGGAGLPDVTKRAVLLRVPSDLSVRVERLFYKKGDKGSKASYLRALEAATDGTPLTKSDLDAIASEMARNRAANVRRKIAYAKKHGTRTYSHETDIE